MYPLSNNPLTVEGTNWPYIEKGLESWKVPQSYTQYQQQRSTTVAKSCSLLITDVGQARSKFCTELVPPFIIKGTNSE